MVLTFTRPLTEFIKTGCFDSQNREIFPSSLVSTLESWVQWLYKLHDWESPSGEFVARKRAAALGVQHMAAEGRIGRYDAVFVDEAQDLLPEEVAMLSAWTDNLYFVGDDQQRIYGHGSGLNAVRALVPPPIERTLMFHYRLAPEICAMADRIMSSSGGRPLAATEHYTGPRPGRITQHGPMSADQQLAACAESLRSQVRVYQDLIAQGDRIGIVVATRDDRGRVFDYLETQTGLTGLSKIIRSNTGDVGDYYDPSFDRDTPICIVTVKGCKGLEFRVLHWLFCEALSHYHQARHYYTVVSRAKTSLDIYYEHALPAELARAYAPIGAIEW
jgi:hypothetical protein